MRGWERIWKTLFPGALGGGRPASGRRRMTSCHQRLSYRSVERACCWLFGRIAHCGRAYGGGAKAVEHQRLMGGGSCLSSDPVAPLSAGRLALIRCRSSEERIQR